MIEADLVDCMISLPGQLFYSTQIPVCLWFLARDKQNAKFRDRRGQTLFIDARNLGKMIDRTHRELAEEDIEQIAHTYHAWRSSNNPHSAIQKYEDIPGLCKSATIDDIRGHGHILTPGRYVDAVNVEEDAEQFEEKMERLTAELLELTRQSGVLDKRNWANLKSIGYGS